MMFTKTVLNEVRILIIDYNHDIRIAIPLNWLRLGNGLVPNFSEEILEGKIWAVHKPHRDCSSSLPRSNGHFANKTYPFYKNCLCASKIQSKSVHTQSGNTFAKE